MPSVDERIVEMQFDNKQFEAGVQTSIKSLEKLKKGLNLEESAKSLQNLEKAGKSFSLQSISDSVDAISSRFSALGIMGVTALTRISNAAISAGAQLVKSLTIDPVSTGLTEYETKMNAITTILTNTQDKGTTLDDVNAALAELNEYADKTIYNFAEMTRNIGTFTAAGVDLETSTKAIKGIANLAAGSGSNAQQASTAMYQLSQALAAGRVSLQDWNSVVNAGMGGQLFQSALKETAKEMGIVVDESVSFRDSISATGGKESWLTSDVLIKTLEKFAEDETLVKAATQVKTFSQLLDTMKESVQSGWATSWEYIIGDRDQAIETLTKINDAFGAMINPIADARNEMLKFWNENGGRDAVIDGLANAFQFLKSVLEPISTAFRNIFPPMTGERLVELSNSFKDLTENLKISEPTLDKIQRTFEGLFAILNIGKNLVTATFKAFGSALTYLAPAGDGFLGITANIGDLLVKLNETIEAGDVFEKAFEKIGDVLEPVALVIKAVTGALKDAFDSIRNIDTTGFSDFADKLEERFSPLASIAGIAGKAFETLGKIIEKVSPVFAWLGTIVSNTVQKIGDSFKNADFKTIGDIFNTGIMAALLVGAKKFVDSLGDVSSGFSGILDGLTGSLEAMQTTIKAGTLQKIAVSIGILAASLLVLSLIDSEKLAGALAALTAIFVELSITLKAMTKTLDAGATKGLMSLSSAMIALSVSALILSSAVTKLASLDWEELLRGLAGIAALSLVLVKTAKSLSKISSPLMKGSTGLIMFAASMRILVESVEALGAMDFNSLTKGLIGVGVLCTELALFLKTANFDGMGLKTGTGLILLATSIRILAEAVQAFGVMDVGGLVKGLSAVGVVLVEVSAFMKLTSNSGGLFTTAVGMTVLGSAMLIFGQAVAKIGALSISEIAKGLGAMAIVLAEVAAAARLMPTNLAITSVGVIGMATAITILASAMQTIGGISWNGIAKGLVAIAGSLVIFAAATNAMKGAVKGAAAMLVVSAAIGILTPALKALGQMSLGEIGMALLSLAGTFTVLGLAALVLTPLVPTLLGLAGAIALLGVGTLAVGAGVLALSAGLSALAVAGTGASAALVLMVSSVLSLIPMFIAQVGAGIIELAKVIAEGAPAIGAVLLAIGTQILLVIQVLAPMLVTTVVSLITMLLQTVAANLPSILESGMSILITLLQGIRDNIGQIVTVAIDIIVNFLNGIASKIGDVVASAVSIITAFVGAIGDQIPVVVDAGIQLIVDFIDALSTAISDGVPEIVESIVGLGGSMIEGLVNSLLGGIKSVVDSVKSIGESAISGLKDILGIHSPSKEFGYLGEYSVEGYVGSIMGGLPDVTDAGSEMGSAALDGAIDTLGIQNGVSTVAATDIGSPVSTGIAAGITANTAPENAATQKAQAISQAFQNEFSKIDLSKTTADLEYQLWSKTAGADLNEGQLATAELQKISGQIEFQKQRVELATQEYNAMVSEFGKDSDTAKQKYNSMLQEMISLADLTQQLTDKRTEAAERNAQAYQAYLDELNNNRDYYMGLLDQGITSEQIHEAIMKYVGYDPNFSLDTSPYQNAANSMISSLNGSLSAATGGGGTGNMVSTFTDVGATYISALASGMDSKKDLAVDKMKTVSSKCLEALTAMSSEWKSAGAALAEQLINGMLEKIEQAKSSLTFGSSGGIIEAVVGGTSAGKSPAWWDDEVDTINNSLNGITVKPVVDMDAITSFTKSITGLNLAGMAASAAKLATNVAESRSVSEQPPTTINQFTQNNYSPKPLNRIEIYRQTQNQLSSLKGR